MAPQTLDFSDLGARPVASQGKPGAQLDFSDLGAKSVSADPQADAQQQQTTPSLWDRVTASSDPGAESFDQKHPIIGKPVRYFSSIGGSLLGAPGAIYHAFADDPTDEERQRYADFERSEGEAPGTETSGFKRIGLGLDRLSTRPLINAVQDYASGKVTWQGAKSVLPEALGQGSSAAMTPTLMKGAGAGISRIVRNPAVQSVVGAPVRFAARTTEAAANSKLRPGLKLFTPADEALKTQVKIPGRDFGLSKSAPEPIEPDAVYSPGYRAPRAYYGGQPPEPIPARSGLLLDGETVPEPEPARVTPQGLRQQWSGERTGMPYRPNPRYVPRPVPAEPIPARSGLMLSGEVPPESETLNEPQRLIEKVRTSEDVTPALTGKAPSYYDTDEQAWQRYPKAGSREDLADTRSLQERIRDKFNTEQRGRLSRGIEEGFARNTRPRTSKAELQARFAGAKQSGASLIQKVRAGMQQAEPEFAPAGDDLLPLLEESLRRAKLKQ